MKNLRLRLLALAAATLAALATGTAASPLIDESFDATSGSDLPSGWTAVANGGVVETVANPFLPNLVNPSTRAVRLAGTDPITFNNVGAFNTLLSPVLDLSGYYTGSGASAVPRPGADFDLSLFGAATATSGQLLAVGFADAGGTVYKWYAAHASWLNVPFPVTGFGNNAAPANTWWSATLNDLHLALPAAGFDPSAVRLAFAHIDGSNPAHNFAEVYLDQVVLTSGLVAYGDRLAYPVSAATPLPVLANDTGANLLITGVSGAGFSIAPGGQALFYDAAAPGAGSVHDENYVIGGYTVTDGVKTATALVVLTTPQRGALPPRPPRFPAAFRVRSSVIDPINNFFDETEIFFDWTRQLQRVDIIFNNPNETPLSIAIILKPVQGASFRINPQPDGSFTTIQGVYNISLNPLLMPPHAAFIGYETVDGVRYERWITETELTFDTYSGHRTVISGVPVFIPREIVSTSKTSPTTVSSILRYHDMTVYPLGYPADQLSVFDQNNYVP